MRIALLEAKMAVKSPIKETLIKGDFDEYYQDGEPGESYWGRNKVNEELLIENMPNDFLNSFEPNAVAIAVEMEISEKHGHSLGNRGQTNLRIFSSEDRRFTLLLCRD